jgi:lactoylglutathione lyase
MTQKPTVAFSHFSVCASNLEHSARFYTEVLGFALDYYVDVAAPFDTLTELPGIRSRVGFFKHGNILIELLGYEHPTAVGSRERRPMNQIGLTHISFVVDDIDAVTNLIVQYGGRHLAETRVRGPHGEMVFCTDPDGVRIELWQKSA